MYRQNNQLEFAKYMQNLLVEAQNKGPQSVVQMLSQQYPQAAQQAQQMINGGASIKEAAMHILQQRGIDPTMFMGKKF